MSKITTSIKCACRREEVLHREGKECHGFMCRCEKYQPEIPGAASEAQDPLCVCDCEMSMHVDGELNCHTEDCGCKEFEAAECPECLGTGEVTVMAPVWPGEPHTADIGTKKCICQLGTEELVGPAGRCAQCGCTEDRACEGGCSWVTPGKNLCTNCQ